MKRKISGYDLPIELEEQILLKLPVKSLVRFRCACKSWKSLITSKKFVKDHLQAKIHNNKKAFSDNNASSSVIVFTQVYKSHLLSLLSISDYTTTVEEIYTPRILGDEIQHDLFSSHCHGIHCWVYQISSLLERIVFYNPALREHRSLLAPTCKKVGFWYAFGHDPKTDDYKLVRIADDDKAEVYSLHTDSWRQFKIEELDSCGHGVCLKGRCYWVHWALENNLVSFDMSEWSSWRADLPAGAYWDCNGDLNPKLMARGESLACITFDVTYEGVAESFHVWSMEGDCGGWAKQFKIDMSLLRGLDVPVAFWKEDEVLCQMQRNKTILTYNLRTKLLKKLDGPMGTSSLYVESLVPV